MLGYNTNTKRKSIPVVLARTGAVPPTFLAYGYCGKFRLMPTEGRTVGDVQRDVLIKLANSELEPVFCVQC